MSSQEVVDFIQSKISQRDENGELRLLSSIVEEVSLKLEEGAWFTQTSLEMRAEVGSSINHCTH